MSRTHRGQITGKPVTRRLPLPAGGVQLETFVPWTLVKRGARKQIITPLGAPQQFLAEARRERQQHQDLQDSALLRALGLAHHWQRLLDGQRVACADEIAQAEGIDASHVRRVLRLTLLAPEFVEHLLDAPAAALEPLIRRRWPDNWSKHGRALCPPE